MAINGIDNSGVGLNLPSYLRSPAGAPERRAPEGVTVPATSVPQPSSSEATLPVAAPPGTDPALWSVLTSEERVFFARIRSLVAGALPRRITTTVAPRPR